MASSDMVVYTCILNTQEADAEERGVEGQPGLCSETLLRTDITLKVVRGLPCHSVTQPSLSVVTAVSLISIEVYGNPTTDFPA